MGEIVINGFIVYLKLQDELRMSKECAFEWMVEYIQSLKKSWPEEESDPDVGIRFCAECSRRIDGDKIGRSLVDTNLLKKVHEDDILTDAFIRSIDLYGSMCSYCCGSVSDLEDNDYVFFTSFKIGDSYDREELCRLEDRLKIRLFNPEEMYCVFEYYNLNYVSNVRRCLEKGFKHSRRRKSF
jgi:hypothetical protein